MQREWFYEFELADGRKTKSRAPDDVLALHLTRRAMVAAAAEAALQGDWSPATCLDMACHEGFFSVDLARRGCKDVLGIDVRPENVSAARLMAEAQGLGNVRFSVRDLTSLTASELGRFDVVLMLGIIYHLENPVGALRTALSHTRRLCIVETQLAPNLSGVIDWGSHQYTKQLRGTFAVVDEEDETRTDNREANTGPISLVPSVEALTFVMHRVGFARVATMDAPRTSSDQLLSGKRTMLLGFVE